MRRPDVELTDDAAQFVERHPDLIARLAGNAGTTGPVDPQQLHERRARFRDYVREQRAFAGSGEAHAAGEQFLARFTGR